MKLASDAGVTGKENRAWALYQFANLFLKEGKLDTAEFIYKGILEERANYPYALAGLADVHSVRGEFDAAIQLLDQHDCPAPNPPDPLYERGKSPP